MAVSLRSGIRGALWDLIAFDIIFKVLVAVVFAPLTSWVFNRLLSLSGNFVISNDQLVSFFLSPQGLMADIFRDIQLFASID